MEKNQEYGYSLEDHIAWEGAQQQHLEGQGFLIRGEGVNEPEEWLEKNEHTFQEENRLNLWVLRMQEQEKLEKTRKLNEKYDKFESEKAKSREEADKFNALPPYDKLCNSLRYYAGFLSKSTNSFDVELSEKIVSAIYNARHGDFSSMTNLFVVLNEKALVDMDLAAAVPEWEKYFNQWKQMVSKKDNSKKEEYIKASWFTRLTSKLKGAKTNFVDGGKKR